MSSSISKITLPTFAGMLPRRRLCRLVDKALRGQVLWVSGPPGCGKTTAVSMYVSARRRRCLWYHVDAGDADPASFFHCLQLAVDGCARRNEKRSVLFDAGSATSPDTDSQRCIERLFTTLSPDGLLVFDNVQAAPADSPFYEVLWDSLARLPRGLSVILISRSDPPAFFARFRASNPGGYLGWDHLRLTREEAVAIVRKRRGGKGRRDFADHLYARSDGWMAGFVLLLERGAGGDVESQTILRSPPDEIFEYFGSEVFERLGEDLRGFLMKTAFLPDVTARTAAAMTDEPAAGRLLADLYRHGHFTEKHAGEVPVYRYHSLFREFLLHRAQECFRPDQLLGIRRRAAAVLEESGLPEEAAVMLRDSGDWEGLARIVRGKARELHAQGRLRTLAEWILMLPEDVRRNDPWLLYWNGICHIGVAPETSRACLERAVDVFEARGNVEGVLWSWAGLVEAIVLEWNDFTLLDPWIDWLNRRMAEGLVFPSTESEAQVATAMLGAAIFRHPKVPDIGRWADRALSLSRGTGDGRLRLQAQLYAVLHELLAGDRVKATIMLEEGRRLAEHAKVPPALFTMWKCLEVAASLAGGGDRGLADRSLAEGLKAARQNGLRLCGHLFPGLTAMRFLLEGDLNGATLSLREMESTLVPPRLHASYLYEYLCAWLQLLRGDAARAAAHAERALSHAAKSGMTFHEVLCRLAMVNIAMERGKTAEAGSGLSVARALIRSTGSMLLMYAARLSEARLALDQGDEIGALDALREGLALGREQGYARVCWWWKPASLARLCLKALDAGIESDHVRHLIVRNNLAPETPPMETENWPWPIKIFTFGRFGLVKDGEPLQSSGRAQQKPLLMLKALIACGGRGISEERIVDIMWPDVEGDLAHQSFATTLRRLRRLLGNDKAILLRDGRLTLNNRYCWVDVWAFQRLLGRAESEWSRSGGGAGPAILVERAMTLYQGPFLAGETFCVCLVSVRERLRSKFLRSVGEAGRSCEKAGDLKRAIAFYQKGLEVDGLVEEFYRCLIACHKNLGEYAEALRVFGRCREILSSVLGVRPSPGTEQEVRSIQNI